MSTEQTLKKFDLFAILDESDLALITGACVSILRFRAAELFTGRFEIGSDHKSSVAQMLGALQAAVANKTAALSALQAEIDNLVAGQGAQELFLASTAGERLNLAWNALLSGDAATLATCNTYAPNDIGEHDVSRGIFWKLVRQAGIIMISGGWGGGSFEGERHGNLTFMLGESGLYVGYDHIFDSRRKIDEKSYKTAVVYGKVVPVGTGYKLEQNNEPNEDAESVAAMAKAVGAALIAHYKY